METATWKEVIPLTILFRANGIPAQRTSPVFGCAADYGWPAARQGV